MNRAHLCVLWATGSLHTHCSFAIISYSPCYKEEALLSHSHPGRPLSEVIGTKGLYHQNVTWQERSRLLRARREDAGSQRDTKGHITTVRTQHTPDRLTVIYSVSQVGAQLK